MVVFEWLFEIVFSELGSMGLINYRYTVVCEGYLPILFGFVGLTFDSDRVRLYHMEGSPNALVEFMLWWVILEDDKIHLLPLPPMIFQKARGDVVLAS